MNDPVFYSHPMVKPHGEGCKCGRPVAEMPADGNVFVGLRLDRMAEAVDEMGRQRGLARSAALMRAARGTPSTEETEAPALARQVGGGHYKSLAIQPVEYCQKNNLGFCESSVVKYVSRYKYKQGLEDLLKARHFIDLLIEIEYGEQQD